MAKDRTAGVRSTYDPEADVFAIYLGPLRAALGAREVSPHHYIHLDDRGRIVSLEILRASEYYGRELLGELPSPDRRMMLTEAAEAAGLASTTMRSQIHAGRLPALKRGPDWLVAEHELWNYLENRAPQGRPGGVARVKTPQSGGGQQSSRRSLAIRSPRTAEGRAYRRSGGAANHAGFQAGRKGQKPGSRGSAT